MWKEQNGRTLVDVDVDRPKTKKFWVVKYVVSQEIFIPPRTYDRSAQRIAQGRLDRIIFIPP
jgi:hypothetical protein